MTDRPIIFSAPMVRALLEGRKTQTRRVLNGKSGILAARSVLRRGAHWLGIEYDRSWLLRLPYAPGDRLYMRETFSLDGLADGECLYRATVSGDTGYYAEEIAEIRWRPSIHMPRWASRLTLIVRDVRVQRLWEISNEDAIAEGIEPHGHAFTGYGKQSDIWMAPYDSFASLWNNLYGPDAWAANPWVAAISFRVIRANIDSPEAAQ